MQFVHRATSPTDGTGVHVHVRAPPVSGLCQRDRAGMYIAKARSACANTRVEQKEFR